MCELLPKAEFYILTFDSREQFEFAVFTAWKGHTFMIRKINSGSMYIYRSITTIKKSPVLGTIGDYFKLQKLDKKSPHPIIKYSGLWAFKGLYMCLRLSESGLWSSLPLVTCDFTEAGVWVVHSGRLVMEWVMGPRAQLPSAPQCSFLSSALTHSAGRFYDMGCGELCFTRGFKYMFHDF